jgi:hypothetical protein
MKTYIKQIILLLSTALMIWIGGCKKETLLGTYYCAKHNINFGPPNSASNSDTIIGYATISVYQSGAQVIINNETLDQTYNMNGTVVYTNPTPGANTQGFYYDNAVFVNSFDSIVYSYNYAKVGVVASGTNSSYQGHRTN